MKHLKTYKLFETLGISKELENQVEVYYDKIKNSIDNVFNFKYMVDNRSYSFTLNIKKLKDGDQGSFGIVNTELVINLIDRSDKGTLLHEVKHLDYLIKNKNCFDNIFFRSLQNLQMLSKKDPLNTMKTIFYVFDENEFQAKYHGLYVDFDEYIKDKVEKLSSLLNRPIKKITNNQILSYFYQFLQSSTDKTWTWYWYTPEDSPLYQKRGAKATKFTFDSYLSERDINKLFHLYVYKKDFYPDDVSIFKYIYNDLKKSFKTTFNKYSKEELNEIQKMKKYFEIEINKKIKKYHRRLYRIVTLMSDKWVNQ